MSDAAPSADGAGAPGAPSEGGVHRLLDMLVEEVSLVDRAANKRRFLVVKREAEMPKKKTDQVSEGTKASPAAAAPQGAPGKKPPKAKKPSKKPADEEAAAKAKKPPPAKDPPDEEEEDDDEEEGGKDGKTSKAQPPKKDPEEDGDEEEEEEEEEEQEDEPDDAPPSGGTPPAKKPPKKKAEKEDDGAPALGGPDDESPDDEETPLSVALAALDSLTQAVEILSGSPEDGSQLASVAEDIRAAADAISSAAGIAPEDDENEEPSGEASIAGLVASIQEMLTKIESLTQALSASSQAPATTPTITAETQAPPDLAGTLAEVAQSMKSLDTSMKAQAARLDVLEKRAGVPNSRPAGERAARTEPEEPSWPIDMNRPRDRASVDKNVSFHDD